MEAGNGSPEAFAAAVGGASAGAASSAEHGAPMALAELQAAVASAAQIHLLAAQPLPVVMGAFADAMATDSGPDGAGAEHGSTPRRGGGGRGRASSAGSKPRPGTMFCQVEDCGAALEGLREYHQRYKVCEEHLKIPFIVKDGEQVRFCQQCGRFQLLSEFDGDKRSCRVRLQRHNARRRKRPRDGTAGAGSAADLLQLGGAAASASTMAAAAEVARLQAQFAAGAAAAPAVSPQEVQAMQEALHFATTTLAHSTQPAARPEGEGEDQGETEGEGGGGAGPAQGLGPGSMPFVPAPDVMMLLLKGYAAMFHYYLDAATIRPLAPPSELPADLMQTAGQLGAAGMAGIEGLMAAGQLGSEGQAGAGEDDGAAQPTGSGSQGPTQQQQQEEQQEEEQEQEQLEQEPGEAESPHEATSVAADADDTDVDG